MDMHASPPAFLYIFFKICTLLTYKVTLDDEGMLWEIG